MATMLAAIALPTLDDPFQSLVVKWMELGIAPCTQQVS